MGGSKLHVAILASPGMGHLSPAFLLADRLVTHHNLDVTILAVTTQLSPAESQLLHPRNASKLLQIVQIPIPDISGTVDSNAAVVTQLATMMRKSKPAIRSAVAVMDRRPDVLVVDLFGTEAWPIADEFNMPKYLFVPTTAWFVAVTSYCHVLDKEVEGQYVDQKEPLRIPGCNPVRPEDVVDPMLDRNDQQYREYVRMGIEYSLYDGILMNTWEDLEPKSLKALRDDEVLRTVVKAPVYPIGPLRKTVEPASLKNEVIKWLDGQPGESVIYVSFGSGGTMSAAQITELAWGLELSQQRFVWVVRAPTEGVVDANFFTSGNGSDGSPNYLPDRFSTRTRNIGLVVSGWASQVEILNHPSVGGFLSHCGWNSTLESITSGVPLIAWPLYAEQRQNATILAEELGVAVRPAVLPTKKVVGRGEIEKMVRSLMEEEEGKTMRERVKELKYSADKAIREGGTSYNSMCAVVKDCQMRLQMNKDNGHD